MSRFIRSSCRRFAFVTAAIAVLFAPASLRSQSLLDRPPNVSGEWVGAPGTLYFHFIHRFSTSGAPERKVTNVPTFLVGASLPLHFFAGLNYSTNSTLAPQFPNEWELFTRWAPLSQDLGAPLDLGGQVGYNNAAQGVDGEVSVARRFGISRVVIAGRALSDPLEKNHQRFAIAGGGTIRLGTYLALAGDVASLTGRDSSERVAWSAGLHLAIPLTPHTLSLQVTNTLVETLQGASRGANRKRYGFEFTIPLTLGRYFGKRATQSPETDSTNQAAAADSGHATLAAASEPAPLPDKVSSDTSAAKSSTNQPSAPAVPTRASTPSSPTVPKTAVAPPVPSTAAPKALPGAGKIVRNGMKNVNYLQGHLQVDVGTTVVWTNTDPLAHTVTAVNKSFNSGLVQPGKTYRHTFNQAGTYSYFCMPHPFMKGVIVVKQ